MNFLIGVGGNLKGDRRKFFATWIIGFISNGSDFSFSKLYRIEKWEQLLKSHYLI